MLEDSVKQFYELIDVHGDKLQGFFEGLPEEDAKRVGKLKKALKAFDWEAMEELLK